jgi:hypothetical protein
MADSQDKDQIAQEAIRSGANRTIAAIEKAFIRNASGRYVTLTVDRHDNQLPASQGSTRNETSARNKGRR